MRARNRKLILSLLTLLVVTVFVISVLPLNTVADPKPPKKVKNTFPTNSYKYLFDKEVRKGNKVGYVVGYDDTNNDSKLSVCDDIAVMWYHPSSIAETITWYHVDKIKKTSTGKPLQPWNYTVTMSIVD